MLDEAERTLVNLMRGEGNSADSDVRYSVKTDINGNPFVEIDDDILDGVPKNQWVKTVKNALSSRTIDVNGFEVAIKAVTRNEYLNSKEAYNLKNSSRNIYEDKLRMVNNIDEIVQNAYNTKNENSKHGNFPSFNRGKIAVRVGSNDYMIDVVTGINQSNNEILYDLVNISKTKIKEVFPQGLQKARPLYTGKTSSANNIPQATQNSNGKKAQNTAGNNNGKFSLKVPVEETKNLVAVHNITEEKLNKAFELGNGLPAPSIAVTKAEMGHSQFGNISLVYGKDSIDPQLNSKNKIYGADAWTPTFPNIEYKADEAKMREIDREFADLSKNVFGGEFSRSSVLRGIISNDTSTKSVEQLVSALSENETIKTAYAADKGINIEPVYSTRKYVDGYTNKIVELAKESIGIQNIAQMESQILVGEGLSDKDVSTIKTLVKDYWENSRFKKPDSFIQKQVDNIGLKEAKSIVNGLWDGTNGNETKGGLDTYATMVELNKKIDDNDLKKWIEGKISTAITDQGLYNGKEANTNNGDRRSFDKLHYTVTLENIVKAMYQDGTEKGVSQVGNNIFGAAAKNFESIGDVKAHSNQLQVLPEDYNDIRRGFQNRLYEIADKMAIRNNSDSVAQLLTEAVGKSKNLGGISSYIKKEGKGWINYSENEVYKLKNLVNDIANMPTDYFEAKPQRVVGFSEVKAAIVPDSKSVAFIEKLKNAGVQNVVIYEAENESDRLKKLNELEDVRFSLKINDKEQKYTTRRDIADYTENSYNKSGWVVLNNVLSKNESASFYSKLKDTYLEKSKDGLYIVPVGDKFGVNNKLVFTDKNFNSPSIEKVIEINLDNETDIEIVRDFIYEQESGKWPRTSNVIESFNENGLLREFRLRDFESFQEFTGRRSSSQTNNGINQQQQDGSGNTGKTESTLDTTQNGLKDTSSGGSFSLPVESKKISGADAEGRNIERSAVNNFLNDTVNMFGVPYSFNTAPPCFLFLVIISQFAYGTA